MSNIDASKIKQDLGWKSRYTFEDGIEETVSWYLDNLDWYERISNNKKYNFQRLGKIDD